MAAAESPLVPASAARRRRPDRRRSRRPGGEAAACASITSTSTSRTASPAPPSTRPISTTTPGGWKARSISRCRPTPRCRGWRCTSDGKLMEGGMAERDHARAVYETDRQQPARPGPARMGGRQHVQDARLPAGRPAGEAHHPQLHAAAARRSTAGRSTASPPATACSRSRDWSFHARVKNGGGLAWRQPVAPAHDGRRRDGDDLVLDATREGRSSSTATWSLRPDRDAGREPTATPAPLLARRARTATAT